jgi:pimeloyl-ACP methyl ester carboxylesterase
MISGSAQDFKLVVDFMPAYLPQFSGFHNIMMGVSLGGHTAWRLAALAPGQFEAFAIVVGCPNLTSLLVERLGIDPNDLNTKGEELDTVSYEHLSKVMNEQQRRRWPSALAELVREGDRRVYEEFPTDLPLLMCNGVHDQLVPARYTSSWLERTSRMNNESVSKKKKSRLFVQENTGHSCTKEMVNMIAEWLGDMYRL